MEMVTALHSSPTPFISLTNPNPNPKRGFSFSSSLLVNQLFGRTLSSTLTTKPPFNFHSRNSIRTSLKCSVSGATEAVPGEAGLFSEAVDFINESPFSDSQLLWRTLVHVCKQCGNLNFGKMASKCLLDLEPKEAGSYILVSNMYAGEDVFDEASRVRIVMNDLKLSKEAGCSWIEIDNKTHWFVVSNRDLPKSRDIYAILDQLRVEMEHIW